MGEAIGSAAGAAGQDASAVYALGSSQGESGRLLRQAEELAADSAALLDRVGLRPGQSAIDLGCGPRGVLDLLARRVAPAGRVVGLDSNPAHAAMAAWFVAERGLGGVEVVTADARSTGLPPGSFDLVHARTLLVNLPEPGEVAAEMMRLARPGGWVASMEPDTEHALCYPPHPAFDRLRDIFTVAFRRNGADPWIGRRVPGLFRRAGLQQVEVEARVQMYPHGNSRRTIRLDLVQSMRPQVLEMGLATDTELDELDAAARAHLDDPDTVVMSGLLFLTWGRKPDHAPGDLLPACIAAGAQRAARSAAAYDRAVSEAPDYAFPHSAEDESRRLELLEQRLDPLTKRRIQRLGVGKGARCLEIGGGRGSITRWLSDVVGPAGRVIATDLQIGFLSEIDRPLSPFRRSKLARSALRRPRQSPVDQARMTSWRADSSTSAYGASGPPRNDPGLRPGHHPGWQDHRALPSQARRRLNLVQIRPGRSGRENYPLQPQLQPLGQLHDEPCPHEQPRIKNHPLRRTWYSADAAL